MLVCSHALEPSPSFSCRLLLPPDAAFTCARVPIPVAGRAPQEKKEKGGVMQIVPARGICKLFCIPIPPLPIVPSLTCSVTSLSRSPGH